MENSKEITIYDIAKSLKVSPSTVSRALNNDPTVNTKTKKKVSDAAAKMGYRSNLVARSLRQQSSLTIGVIAYDLNSSSMVATLSGIEKVCNGSGYGIIITDSSQSAEKEAINAANLFNRRVDGLIVNLNPGANSLEHFRLFKEKQIPIIFLDGPSMPEAGASITIDHRACGYMAARHLIDQGCKRIAHVTTSLEDKNYLNRYKGFGDALTESKISFTKDMLVLSLPTEESAEQAAQKIMNLQPLPDGLFVADDFIAAVVIRSLIENGIRVPQDIAVVGFNNDIIGRLISPALSTINYPGREIGEAAAQMLINRLRGANEVDKITTVSVRADLIVRQSSQKSI